MKTTAGQMVKDIQKEIVDRLNRIKFMQEHDLDTSYICTKSEKEAIRFLKEDLKYYSKKNENEVVFLGKLEFDENGKQI